MKWFAHWIAPLRIFWTGAAQSLSGRKLGGRSSVAVCQDILGCANPSIPVTAPPPQLTDGPSLVYHGKFSSSTEQPEVCRSVIAPEMLLSFTLSDMAIAQ
jgi:hypothetical protein